MTSSSDKEPGETGEVGGGSDSHPGEQRLHGMPRERLSREHAEHGAERDAMDRMLEAKHAQITELKSQAKRASAETEILTRRIALLDAQIQEMHASSSWRLTAPLRSVSTVMQKLKRSLSNTPGNRRSGGPGVRIRKFLESRSQATPALEGEDTFVLYRIIGNDLYPRHKRGQAVENLRFILGHEPVLPGCEKRFVLNRIFEDDQEREIIGLLEEHGHPYIRLPFDPAEYLKAGFDTDCLPEPDLLASGGFEALDSAKQERLLAALYRHKNNYVMNNNGARNLALRDGRGRAKWVLPWDGNCFVTRDAWEQIRVDVAKAPHNKYFLVPMARMLSNDCLIDGTEPPRPVEEPQIIFRKDAGEEFNPAFCYGRRPKVELLWRLGAEGAWDDYSDDPWDQERSPVSAEAGLVGKAGWVARLSSGMATLEANSGHAALHRGFARSGAILATLQQLDAKASGVDSEHLFSIRAPVLQHEVQNQGAAPLKDLVRVLLQGADEAAMRVRHDPSTEKPNTRAAPGDLQQRLADSMTLALAWSFAGDRAYAESASEVLERLFIDPGSRAEPEFRGSAPGEHRHATTAGVGSMAGLYYYLDAVRILEAAGTVSAPVRATFRSWLGAYLEWLLDSPEGIRERRSPGHRGTSFDLQVASVASFLDDHEVVYGALMRAQGRIAGHFAPDGTQPYNGGGAAKLHNDCINFQSWVNLSEAASRWGVDLWAYRAPGGSCLGQGARWLLSHMEARFPEGRAGAFDVARLQPIWFAAREAIDEVPENDQAPASPYGGKPVFMPSFGIRPFWNFGSFGHPNGPAV